MAIRDQKLLYHLTSLENLEAILRNGLLPRNQMVRFDDVAEPGLIDFRRENGLNGYVPFHFFPKNPFDGRVQTDYPDKDFIYITLSRDFARENNFQIIPMHPRAMRPLELYDFDEGFGIIEWDTMDQKNYLNDVCRHICMAECLSPNTIMPIDFYAFYVKTNEIKTIVRESCLSVLHRSPCFINVNRSMFLG
ncbi:DarT ssDNA thymidine ADP-ribosyltransferase family protein [Candidatus Formimonas warabiya]|uniref:DarT domain-containing protein n=1 Tax=Formimonas warabiya TaxID=1761012 RepID=A0A3G1KQ33_FORW1|nr:DarT ssDNA thymidine ADP-ribosyltransferase family protein [Candidatus Formimonas warabiya]ATW24574.1 hypothetical protein DCMF_07060 [Candidatus Formimonas warabiya]